MAVLTSHDESRGSDAVLLLFHGLNGLINNRAARILVDSGPSYDYISTDFERNFSVCDVPVKQIKFQMVV